MSDGDFSEAEDDSATSSARASDSKRHARAQHNALERRRRDNIKDMYGALKDTIPGMRNERASRAVVLKKSIDLITSQKAELERILTQNRTLEQENVTLQHEIERLKRKSESRIITEQASGDASRRTNRNMPGSDPSQFSAHLNLPKRKRPAPSDDQSTVPKTA
ncbi:Helix-loop-helix DNA-binding domain family protein [Acanthocheilonema viteae]|uniref:BHLH domain-containing protein n=1 Tax=Acanthocheilonema viteae TaxID=6277 RepID=A0A498SIV8_ACAVI|nr:unnamed protein product [Acanthocheilonema viteae]